MVYVKSDGTVCQDLPIYERLFRFIFGIFFFVTFFFKSLLGMDTSNGKASGDPRRGGSFFGGGGSGGGGKPFGPGKPGGGPHIRSMRDINQPTVSATGCSGGACGM